MGGQHSKKKAFRNLSNLERSSSKKRYLPQNQPSGQQTNGANGVNGHAAGDIIEDKSEEELPPFTERQKELVVSTWKVVQDDIARVGVKMFIK